MSISLYLCLLVIQIYLCAIAVSFSFGLLAYAFFFILIAVNSFIIVDYFVKKKNSSTDSKFSDEDKNNN